MCSLDQYELDGAADILTPALLIYPEMVELNIKATLQQLGGNPDRWRPHVKTAKLSFVMEMLLSHGIQHFKAATTLALTLCRLGAPDVLLAYPVVGAKQKRVAELAREYPGTRISVVVESMESAQVWRDIGVGVFVEINPGMDRTGLNEPRLSDVAAAVGSLPYFRGLHFYEGHLHTADFAERAREAHAAYARLMTLVGKLESLGIAVPEVITSGTPTFPCAASYAPFAHASFVHRVSPGTVIYCDLQSLQEVASRAGYVPAALVLSTVMSNPTLHRVTCDAGHKSVGADAGVPTCAVLGHSEYRPQAPNEEHLTIDVYGPNLPRIGETVYLLPRHICPTVNNFDRALLVKHGRIQGIEDVTARGREAPITVVSPQPHSA